MHQASSSPLEFSITGNNPQVRTLSILFSIPFLVLWAGMLSLLAAGTVGWQEALITTSILTLGWGLVFWNIQKYGQGSAIIDPSELVVKTRGYTAYIPWSDVSDVTLTSFADRGARGWARAIRWPERKPYVEIRLSRALRDDWPRGRYGTRLTGIPLIDGDRVALYLDDPRILCSVCNVIRNVLGRIVWKSSVSPVGGRRRARLLVGRSAVLARGAAEERAVSHERRVPRPYRIA